MTVYLFNIIMKVLYGLMKENFEINPKLKIKLVIRLQTSKGCYESKEFFNPLKLTELVEKTWWFP